VISNQYNLAGTGGAGNGRQLFSGGDEYSGAARSPVRVLVVDDDRDTVLTLRMLLDTEGYETRGVHNARATLDAVRDFKPDAVLLDIGMPDMSGYEVARQVRQRHGEKPVLIALTAWTKASDKLLAQLAGFNHHVSKPYRPEEILTLLTPLTMGRR
jgi:CheY-like chemotaxis protein